MSEVVPEGWKSQKLGDLLVSLPKSRHPSGVSDDKGYYNFYVCSSDIQKSFKCDVKEPSVLFSTGGEAAIHYATGKYSFSTDVWATKFIGNLTNEFVFRYLELNIEKINYLGFQGSGIKHLDKDFIKKLNFAFPSLPEQKKIASILTSVDEVIEKTQSQIDKLQDLKKGTMNELLTKGIGHTEFKDSELGRIPKSWEVKRLGDLFILTSGKSKPTRLLSPIMTKVNSIPVYGGNGVNGYTDSALLDNPTIVIGRVGEYCGCVEVTPIFSWITDNALYIKSVLQKYDMMFMFYLMTFSNLSKLRSKGGQPLVSQQPIHEYSVALPSVEEQQNISGIISAINDKIEIQNKKLHQTQSLKKSLMQDLLTGKVRVKIN